MKILERKFPLQMKVSGGGNLVGQATEAKVLADGKLADSVAIIVSKVYINLYSELVIIDKCP